MATLVPEIPCCVLLSQNSLNLSQKYLSRNKFFSYNGGFAPDGTPIRTKRFIGQVTDQLLKFRRPGVERIKNVLTGDVDDGRRAVGKSGLGQLVPSHRFAAGVGRF